MADQTISMRQTIQQRRGAQSFHDIQDVKTQAAGTAKSEKAKDPVKRAAEIQSEYRSLARSVTGDILNHGLGQILAFLLAKGKEKGKFKKGSSHSLLYQHLCEWVCREMGWGKVDLFDKLTADTTTTADYRRATVEAIAYISWLKRFAEAELSESQ
jgi:CRISPR-associated protein Cmr5